MAYPKSTVALSIAIKIFLLISIDWTLKNQPGTMWQGKFTAFNDSCVVNPWNPTTHSLAGDSEGLYVQVYKDKVEVTGRDFTNKLWIDSYAVKIPSSKSSKESDQLESGINSN